MKLLVCDIEGTIFQPHMIKSAQHASYIWTAIAEALGKDAEREEINTQRKWRNGGYGQYNTGAAYMDWVNASIEIHKQYGLTRSTFEELICKAPYMRGVEKFFSRLNRNEYIPVFISGGIQNLNRKACMDLGVDIDDSYASCEYFFNHAGKIDDSMTLSNTCNFYGKHELIRIALRKHGLGDNDWIFIGDGINDVDVAKGAPLSIGIAPIDELREVAAYSFEDFEELLQCSELLSDQHLLAETPSAKPVSDQQAESIRQRSVTAVNKQVAKLNLDNLEERAYRKFRKEIGDDDAQKSKRRFFGIQHLLLQGEYLLALLEQAGETEVASAALQSFCSASEIMVNITMALTGNSAGLHELVNSENTLKKSIDKINNANLKTVLHAYRQIRNTIAHSYQVISLEAAHALARRTYENIQRLELIVNP